MTLTLSVPMSELIVPNLPYGWKWSTPNPNYLSDDGTYKLTVSAERTERDFDGIFKIFSVDMETDSYDDILERFQDAAEQVASECTAESRAGTEESKREFICVSYTIN